MHGRQHVLFSVDPERGRVHRVPEIPTRTLARDTPFTLLARKHLRGAIIRALSQPYLERVWEIEVEQRDDAGHKYLVRLIVEVMGRRGNLLLVDQHGTILDAARRAPPSRNPIRPILPHLPYVPAPPLERIDPFRVGPVDLASAAQGRSGSVESVLVGTLAGLSPAASREIVFRAFGTQAPSLHQTPWDILALAIHAFFEPVRSGAWSPCLATQDDALVDYAPYRLTHLEARGARLQVCASFDDAAQKAANAPRATRDALRVDRERLAGPLRTARSALARRIVSLERESASEEERALLRRAGETLLSRQDDFRGRADMEIDGARLSLDPTLTPVENAQHFFSRYRKMRDASVRIPELLEETRQQEHYLAQLAALVDTATTMDDMRALRAEVLPAVGMPEPARHKGVSKRATAAPTGSYRRFTIPPDWELLVGTSAQGNATVTFKMAHPDDLWLHAHEVPGAHAILRATHREAPSEAVLARAAEIAAWHSARRSDNLVDVDVASVRHVRKIPHGPAGLVRYTGERTFHVRPSPAD